MNRLVGGLLVLGVVGLVSNPTPADAQGSDAEHKLVKCMNAAIESCDARYPSDDRWTTAIRGWCYLIETAMCD